MTLPVSEQTPEQLAKTKKSKELTDKIHRLIRSFSIQLVRLVSEEIGARAPKVKRKPGPKKGQYKVPPQECPICGKNPNPWRKRAYVCLDCRPKSWRYRRDPKRDHLGAGFKVEVKIPEHLPVKPKDVKLDIPEDIEPDFLDSLALVVPTPIDRPAKAKVTQEDEDFFG